MENQIREFFKLVLLSVSLMTLAATPVVAGGGPENVFLVVNSESRSSKVIANHYIALRNIPSSNVLYLSGVSRKEMISLSDFRKQILEPVLTEMVARKISNNIDYIVYSSDFPTRINIQKHQDLLKKAFGSNFQVRVYRPIASITSMTYFASHVLADDPNYMALNSNHYYRGPYRSSLNKPFEGELQDEYRQAVGALNKTGEEFDAGRRKLFDLSKKYPGQAAVYYQLAKFRAKDGEADLAVQALKHAAAMGWQDVAQIKRERGFRELQESPQFRKLIKQISNIESPYIAPHGFRNAYAWGPNGMINKTGDGRRYFLSAMLSVTRDHGISDSDSIKYLSRAASADDTHPIGAIYFAQTGDVRSTVRQGNFNPTIKVLKQMRQNARVEKVRLPKRRDDIMGLICGNEYFDFEKSGSKFLPGAFADNLTSFGGYFRSKSQTKLTEFLRFGAAGASGTVDEPLALQAKFPHPMFHAHYVAGCSLAEAFYQSVAGPYQIILVADPLCQPFVKRPKLVITSPEPMAEVSGLVNIELSREGSKVKAAGVEIFLDGVMIHRAPNIKNINLETSDLKDGYHELRVVSVARDGIEARSTAAVLPIMINNKQFSTTLSIEETTCEFPAPIKISAETNFGEKIIIRQNHKTVGVITAEKGSIEVSTGAAGIGEIKLQAISLRDGEKAGVASAPAAITVKGAVSSIVEKGK